MAVFASPVSQRMFETRIGEDGYGVLSKLRLSHGPTHSQGRPTVR